MSSTARDVAQFLASEGLGVLGQQASGWSIFWSREPIEPGDSITVYDVSGEEPDTDQQDLLPVFQVRVRAGDYVTGFAKIEAVRDALIDPVTLVVGGTTYIGVEATTDVGHIGRDDRDRDLLVATFRTRKERGV